MKFKITYFTKFIVNAITLVMLMCWASQSSAQPTRAIQIVDKDKSTLSPEIVKRVEESLSEMCTMVNSDAKSFAQGYEPGFADPSTEIIAAFKKLNIGLKNIGFDKVFLIKNPEHGQIVPLATDDTNKGYFAYIPQKGYMGVDNATFEVSIEQFKIKVHYLFRVATDATPDYVGCEILDARIDSQRRLG